MPRNGNSIIVVPPTKETDVIMDKDNQPVRSDDPRWVKANRYMRTPWLQSSYAVKHPLTTEEINSLIPLLSQRFNNRTRFMAKYSLHKESAEGEFRHFRQERDERREQEKRREREKPPEKSYTPTPPQYNDPNSKANVDLRRDPESYKDINELGHSTPPRS